MIDREALSVSAINQAIKQHLESAPQFGYVVVQGEVSNLKEQHGVGHLYFTLKDDDSKINAVMFASSARRLKTIFRDGDHIQVQARITVYEKGGTYQLLVNYAEPLGIGALYQRFEHLKAKLSQRGWFDESHKVEIPQFPKRIGLITAPTGAAVRDMIITARRRWPLATLTIYPCLVQGSGSALSIKQAIERADIDHQDVLILARGGGSIEDLWSYNEEVVAQAIFDCVTPIISGVGHETDTTIADYVADVRAATPTAAIVRATPDQQQISILLQDRHNRVVKLINQQIALKRRELEHYTNLRVLSDSTQWVHERQMTVDQLTFKVAALMQQQTRELKFQLGTLHQQSLHALTRVISEAKHNLSSLSTSITQLNPLSVLARGYSIVKDARGNLVNSIDNVSVGDLLNITLSDGTINTLIQGKENKHGKDSA